MIDEADRNTQNPIEVVTSEAWGATRKMIKGLNYPITHIVHVHKKSYKDVYIWHYEYSQGKRYFLEIWLKADFFKKRAKRRIYVKIYDESINPHVKKKRGCRKGARTRRRDRSRKSRPIMVKRIRGAEKVCVKYFWSDR